MPDPVHLKERDGWIVQEIVKLPEGWRSHDGEVWHCDVPGTIRRATKHLDLTPEQHGIVELITALFVSDI